MSSLKIVFRDQIRRFAFQVDDGEDEFAALCAAVARSFDLGGDVLLSVKYVDDEDELVTISTTQELHEARTISAEAGRSALKLYVDVVGDEDRVEDAADEEESDDEAENEAKSDPDDEEEQQSDDGFVRVDAPETPKVSQPPVMEQPEVEDEQPEVEDEQPEVETEEQPETDEQPAPLPRGEELAMLVEDFLSSADIRNALFQAIPQVQAALQETQSLEAAVAALLAVEVIAAHELVVRVRPHLPRLIACVSQKVPPALLPFILMQLPQLLAFLPPQREHWGGFLARMGLGNAAFDGVFSFDDDDMYSDEEDVAYDDTMVGEGDGGDFGDLPPEPTAVHHGVVCDGCEVHPIVGNRYKCSVCPNFDLCEACETSGVHDDDHPMLKFKVPTRHSARFAHHHGPPPPPHHHPHGPPHHPPHPHGPPHDHHHHHGPPHHHHGHHHRHHRGGHHHGHHGHHGHHHRGGRGRGRGGRGGHGRCWWRRRFNRMSQDATVRATFVSDETIPDHSFCLPDVSLMKVWAMRNTGSAEWPQGSFIQLVHGDVEPDAGRDERLSVPLASPGEVVHVRVPIRTPPKPGHYVGNYRLHTPEGEAFGDRIWVAINVPEPADGALRTPEEIAQAEAEAVLAASREEARRVAQAARQMARDANKETKAAKREARVIKKVAKKAAAAAKKQVKQARKLVKQVKKAARKASKKSSPAPAEPVEEEQEQPEEQQPEEEQPEETSEQVEAEFEYAEALRQLARMGFDNEELNKYLLRSMNGSLQSVVDFHLSRT